MTNTEQIIKDLKWLEERKTSTDIVSISHVLNHLNGLMVSFGDEVTAAYELQCEAEDKYDIAFAKKFSELTASGTSAAAAKPIVESELGELKKEWTKAKVMYKKLNSFMDRVDRLADGFKQSQSILNKVDLKRV
jgi:hypothetical protein